MALRLFLLALSNFILSYFSSLSLSIYTKTPRPEWRRPCSPPFLYCLSNLIWAPLTLHSNLSHQPSFCNSLITPAPCVGVVYSTVTVTGCPTPSPSSWQYVGTVHTTITVTGTLDYPSVVEAPLPVVTIAMTSSSKEVESPATTRKALNQNCSLSHYNPPLLPKFNPD